MLWIVIESIYGEHTIISAYTTEEMAERIAQELRNARENIYSHDYWVETIPLNLENFS